MVYCGYQSLIRYMICTSFLSFSGLPLYFVDRVLWGIKIFNFESSKKYIYIFLWTSSFPNTICWRDCPFPVDWSWHSCWKLLDCIMWGFISGLSVLFHRFIAVFIPISHCFDSCSFVVRLEISKCEFSNFVPFQDSLGSLGSLEIPCELGWTLLFLQNVTLRFW